MRIAIDARMYGLEHAGIGRYVINLINQIDKLSAGGGPASGGATENDYFILLRKKYYRSLVFKNERFKKVLADYPHYSFCEQVLLPLQLFKLKPDLVHFPHFNVPIFWCGKYVVTIHDLIKHESRGLQATTKQPILYWFKYLNYRILVWLAVKRATRIITPSDWWKKELVKRYKLTPEKIVVTYEGVDDKFKIQNSIPKFRDKIQNLLKKYNIQKPFIIYTGSLYPHKNIKRLIQAVAYLNKKKKISLVISCARSVFYNRIRDKLVKMKTREYVNLIGFATDLELATLYKNAKAFIFPSLLEGFGLPGLEAMACGLPVIASNSSCLPEIYGEAALYFDPYDINDMAQKINKVLNDSKLRTKLTKLGYAQVEKYSWEKMGRQTLRIYDESCLNLRPGQ